MALDANSFKTRATGAMAGFSTGQRFVVVIAAATLIAGGLFFAQWASKPAMAPLFTNLDTEDASAITNKLSSQKVKFELADGGKTIMVPQNKVYQLRLDMSGDGLPAGGSQGYSILDKQGITTSEFMQQVGYQRALEGELSKTISAISVVDAATVHLVIPKQDVFSDDSRKPSASVLVKTASGKQLTGGQIQAIVNLTASSVEGLDPADVTLVDDKGRSLAAPGHNSTSGDSDAQVQQTNSVQDDLTRKVQSILTPLVGEGKSVVQARAELNFDKSKSTSEIYNPNNKTATVGSSHTVSEQYDNGDPNSTGVLGPNGIPLSESANGSSSYNKSDSTVDNKVDRTITETEQAVGKIDRISVAILLDSNVPNIDTAEIEKLASDAAGLNTERGDTVTVSRMPFDKTQAEAAGSQLKEAAKAKKQDEMMGMIKTGVTFLIILAVLVMLFVISKRKVDNYASMPISMAELDAARPLNNDDMLGALEGRSPVFELDSPEAQERAKVDKEITGLIEKQPDEVASLLRSWLADRRG